MGLTNSKPDADPIKDTKKKIEYLDSVISAQEKVHKKKGGKRGKHRRTRRLKNRKNKTVSYRRNA